MTTPIIIKSPDGNGNSTTVTLKGGEKIPGVSGIELSIKPLEPVKATLTFCEVALQQVHAITDLTQFVMIVAGRMNTAERNRLISEINSLPPVP